MTKARRFLRVPSAESLDAFLENASRVWKQAYPKANGRPDLVLEVWIACQVAATKLPDPFTQGRLIDATRTVLRDWQQKFPGQFVAPTTATIRRHMQAYLRYRRGMSRQQRDRLPAFLLRALDAPDMSGLHATTLLGLLGDSPAAPLVTPSTKAAEHGELTARIRALKTLP